MASDILGRELTKYGGSFSVDDALLTFPNLKGQAAFVPYIVTTLSLNYQQQVSRFYGLNRNQVFLVAGRAQGNGALSQILAPGGALSDFFATYGDVCKAKGNILQFSMMTGCDGEQRRSDRFTAGIVVVNSLGFNTESETAVINNTFGITFESLQYEESKGDAVAA